MPPGIGGIKNHGAIHHPTRFSDQNHCQYVSIFVTPSNRDPVEFSHTPYSINLEVYKHTNDSSASPKPECLQLMGLLFAGKALAWEDSIPYLEHVREHGIIQFINLWDRFKDRTGDQLLWGDEVGELVSWHLGHLKKRL